MSTSTPETFRIPIEVAEQYEASFVPAFFAQWAPLLCDATDIRVGHRVLDVGCGTGILARTVADRIGTHNIEGVDPNEAMLAVARRVRPELMFRRGEAAALPYPDEAFDVVVSQMALMFFADRASALRDMARVTRHARSPRSAPEHGGTVGILVPAALSRQRAFAPLVDMIGSHAGPHARTLLGSYFVCGELDALADEIGASGLRVRSARTVHGTYRAPSVDAFVATEVESTPLRARLDEQTYLRIQSDAHGVLGPFVTESGAVEAPFAANIVVADRI